MRAGVIETATSLVVNIIELEEGAIWEAPEGCFVRFGDNAAIGMYYMDNQFLISLPE